ncbi:MAG: response regulator transcription factor [Phycisphaerae bacterium]
MSEAELRRPAPVATVHPTILIVDDDAPFRDRLIKALEVRNCRAYGASNKQSGLTLAREITPHAIFIDLRLGPENGSDMLDELRMLSPRPRLIILTGYGSIATAVATMRRGADDYLTKPLTADQVYSAVAGVGPKGAIKPVPERVLRLDQLEWEHIQRVLQDCDGNISRAAAKLGVHRRSLQRKLAKRPLPG